MRVMATLLGAKYDIILAAINTYQSIKVHRQPERQEGKAAMTDSERTASVPECIIPIPTCHCMLLFLRDSGCYPACDFSAIVTSIQH
jgi:hypothetical protein